jgi:hypothetical protein
MSSPYMYIKGKDSRSSWPFQQHSVLKKPKDKSHVNISTKVNKQKIMIDVVRIYNNLVCLVYYNTRPVKKATSWIVSTTHLYTFKVNLFRRKVATLPDFNQLWLLLDLYYSTICRSLQWPRGLRRRSSAARLLRLWVRIPPGAWMFSVVSVVCCQVEVSATDWSLFQRSPTDCGASLLVIKKPRKRGR